MTEIDVPVLIVGAGPIGLLGARLLGRRGIRTLVAEKHQTRLDAPKAHAVNPRTLEICHAAGLPMADIHAAATPTEEGRHIRMVRTLTGTEIGVLPYERQDEAVRDLTPWPLINIAQPDFEAVVEKSVAALPDVQIRRGLEWRRCDQLGGAVISTLVDRATGEEVKVRSRYLIAADGAGSTIRDGIGIPMDGPEALQSNMMIHFEADLRGLVGDRPAILYFLFGPEANGALIAFDIGRTWVLMHQCRADETPKDYDDARCRDLIRRAVGADLPDLEIRGVRSWVMSSQVARRYRDGNVFLVGDAAHRFPPTGGLGLNTGVGDIDNLVWKIIATEEGWAEPSLLDSYEPERRAIAQTNMGQSLANAMRIMTLFEALGYKPDQTVDVETFEARMSDPVSRAKIDAAVEHQREHFDSLRLQLGFAYGDALKADAALPISQFTPRAVVGARLPHAALRDGRSSLELVAAGGLTLISGPEAGAWGSFAEAAPVPLSLAVEGRDFEARSGDWAASVEIGRDGAILMRPDGHILHVARGAGDASAMMEALVAYVKPTAQVRGAA